jgi:hypothetical protein
MKEGGLSAQVPTCHATSAGACGLVGQRRVRPRPVAGPVGHVRPPINAQLARTPSVNKPSQSSSGPSPHTRDSSLLRAGIE